MVDRFKKIIYLSTRLSQVLSKKKSKFSTNKNKKKIIFYPVFTSTVHLADQYNRVKWYLPDYENLEIYFFVDKKLKNISLLELEIPKFQRAIEKSPRIHLTSREIITRRSLINADLICIWDTTSNWLKFVNCYLKIRIVDPEFYLFSETHTYPGILWHDLLSNKNRWHLNYNSRNLYDELFDKFSKSKRAYVFGTGPSIAIADQYNYEDGIRIVCNSIVKNDKLLEKIKPQVIAFTDSVFHFGASKYAENFANDLIKVVEKYEPYIITNQVGYALMSAHYPILKKYMIAIPAKRTGPPIILNPKTFQTRDYANILTRYMLPLAAGLSDEMVLMGFDGRNPKEGYFWKHNNTTQYTETMDSTQITHPAFFRDISYDNYYEIHCKNINKIFLKFESAGKKIRVWGNSYIPAMQERVVSN